MAAKNYNFALKFSQKGGSQPRILFFFWKKMFRTLKSVSKSHRPEASVADQPISGIQNSAICYDI